MDKFNYNKNDVVSFPDTESEYVDIGIGSVKVAEIECETLCKVVKRGRGLALKMIYNTDYSETFHRSGKKGFISLKEYLNHFGNWNDLKYVCNILELN